jgi:putative glycosyltransferase
VDLSIVTTLYRSAPYLKEFCRRAIACAVVRYPNVEVILVDDGSPDDSREVALAIRARDPRVKLVELSRNYGQHKAIMTGLRFARGRLVFLLDSDLEEPPELLRSLAVEMGRTGADVVYGVQARRKGGWFERISGDTFYRVFRWLSACPLPANQVTARLMTRAYVRSLVRHRDREVFLAGLWSITGFRQVPLVVSKSSKGTSSYSVPKKVAMVVNAVTSFSQRPLVGIFHLGCAILAVSGTAGLVLLLRRVFFQEYLAGWPSLIISIWFLGGLMLFCQGIMAIYLAKVFAETKRRPYTVVRAWHGTDQDREGAQHARHRKRRPPRPDRGLLRGQAPHVRPLAEGSGLELDRVAGPEVRAAPEGPRA